MPNPFIETTKIDKARYLKDIRAVGLSVVRIADELGMTEKTIRGYLDRGRIPVYRKEEIDRVIQAWRGGEAYG